MKSFAFVFPGQGSQSVGMLDGWGNHPAVVQALQEASDALHEDVAGLIREGPQDALALTTNTQPVMLVAGVAAYRAWIAETGALPALVAGHSLGEYSALVAAGVLSLAQAAPLVRFRAQAMQDAVPVGAGAMAAVLGLSAQQVIAGCAEVMRSFGAGSAELVEAANFNDPVQTVIAGSKAAVEQACAALKAAGAKRVLPLPVSAPFHSSLMRPAAERLAERLNAVELAAPRIPVLNNVDVAVETDVGRIRDALVRQAWRPVRWVESIGAIHARGITTVVECGPGKVLARTVHRIDTGLTGLALYDPATLAQVKGALQ
ncbi:MAG: Malonyl CoA-acyl carrier protein transacylase [Burkholderiaceae bacterium]|jgi:[acyl-carrier-protein] S-malonyltransferase|nr:MAG: Malonyl CoA-acyl carrier protein transacylase [Burkholderiaceae bacterium]